MRSFVLLAACATLTAACNRSSTPDATIDGSTESGTSDGGGDAGSTDGPITDVPAGGPAVFLFDTAADLTVSTSFYDMPYPSDLRLTAQNTPDLRGFPIPPGNRIVPNLLTVAQQRPKWPTLSVAYFRFTNALSMHTTDTVIPAVATSPVLLIDVDPTSSERGRLFPTVAANLETDAYTTSNVLAVAARPGFVLRSNRQYAYVVMNALGGADGTPLSSPPAFERIKQGQPPPGANGAALLSLYTPLLETLATLHIDAAQMAAATVFTTGDVVQQTASLGDAVTAMYHPTIDGLHAVADDTPPHNASYCHLVGTITLPQFQQGTPPFDTGGLFQFGTDGLPMPTTYPTVPTYATVPVSIALPSGTGNGTYPLVTYFHGSGGVSSAVVDRGVWRPQSATFTCTGQTPDVWNGVSGCNTLGLGPGYVLAQRGIAAAGTALPMNPERLPGATETAYLNVNNLAAFRDTFRQGVLEQRLFIQALSALQIPASVVGACDHAVRVNTGTNTVSFDTSRLVVQGQSMGGMYTNLIAATDPHIHAAIPTGAGGFWGYFILQTQLIPGAGTLLGVLLNTRAHLSFVHPALSLLETSWESADPIVYMARMGRDPLPGHPTRSIYEPVGQGDSYFPTTVYDAAALSYGHRESGTAVWSTMQPALQLAGLDGLLTYPAMNDVMDRGGHAYTGVIVQYAGDGVYDPHALYSQLDAVKYQYSCFASSFITTGTGTVYDPANLVAQPGMEPGQANCR